MEKIKGSGASATFQLHNGEEATFAYSGFLEVSVTDTGAGMTKKQLSQVFGEGVQFDVNKLQAGQGSGLGLHIAKGIVEQHGGSLTVQSDGLGLGTTFTMKLLMYHVPPDVLEPGGTGSAAATFPSSAASADFSPLRVLVVDDAALNRKLLARLLENQGHVCDQAEDGLKAVASVKASMRRGTRYDTILLDSQMPNMTGPAAARKIRDLGCDSFIVGITGNVFSDDISYFLECGANKVLPKPLNVNDLMDVWKEYGIGGAPPLSRLPGIPEGARASVAAPLRKDLKAPQHRRASY